MTPPGSTYRLQLTPRFPLDAAREVLPYLDALGVDTVYLSPVLTSRRGSTHGYDVVDPTHADPELGGDAAFESFLAAARARGIGTILDIVPNHMAASLENPWWRDVLARGRSSRYARFFDIDWRAHGGKLVLPVLGAPIEEEIASGGLTVGRDVIRSKELELPAPGARPGDPIEEVLERQAYRLEFWREALSHLNYRRFFDVSDLVAVRADRPAVFRAMHRLVTRLVRRRLVWGIRVDHIDGLHDPGAYLLRLRRAVGDAHVIVEKILARGERLHGDWPVEGTTGYEFANAATDVLTDPAGADRLTAIAAGFSGDDRPFDELMRERKRQVLGQLFPREVRSLTDELERLAARSPRHRAVAPQELRAALIEATAALPVYRTYVRERHLSDADRRVLRVAVTEARRSGVAPAAVDLLHAVLSLEPPRGISATSCMRFAMRWQRLTGPAMAKGLEDTAMYTSNALVSRNEVGGDPGRPPMGPAGFHRFARERLSRSPGSLNATSTHDTKRSEDVRARLAVLSEIPEAWERSLRRLHRGTRRHRRGPDPRRSPDPQEELLLYQQVLGAWPIEGPPDEGFADRIAAATEKGMREAKTHTSWLDPDEAHESAVLGFVRDSLADERFRREIASLDRRIAVAGASNGLAQVLLKVAAPGIPDVYQGTELWHRRLVDPDNREEVDFDERAAMLQELDRRAGELPGLVDELRGRWRDGRLKLLVTAAALRARRERADLFARGAYVPLAARGAKRNHVLAFGRRRRSRWVVAVAARLTVAVAADGWATGDAWRGTSLQLPAEAPRRWRDLLTGAEVAGRGSAVPLRLILARLPVALLAAD